MNKVFRWFLYFVVLVFGASLIYHSPQPSPEAALLMSLGLSKPLAIGIESIIVIVLVISTGLMFRPPEPKGVGYTAGCLTPQQAFSFAFRSREITDYEGWAMTKHVASCRKCDQDVAWLKDFKKESDRHPRVETRGRK